MSSPSTKRTLVREVLISQLAFAAFVGLVAIGCVWWVSNWVVRDNLDDWAVRWVGEMESLGSGFFIDSTDDRFLELSRYLSRFSEIEYVRYYDLHGEVIYLESAVELPAIYPPLTQAEMDHLHQVAKPAAGREGQDRYQMDLSREPMVRISQAVSREAIVSANLFSAESLSELESEATVVGFVELGLDYGAYDRDLLAGVSAGSAIVLLAFLVLMLAGRVALRKAVQPLVDMQQPLDRIAQGDLEVSVPASSHREIAAVGDALETALAAIRERDAHLTRLANYDPLTGLVARYHFVEELQTRLDTDASGALFFIDLDQFKHVNDTYGHDAGDEVLVQIGARLKQLVRRGDLLGRLGGDEFVLYVSEITGSDAMSIADKIIRDMSEFPLVSAGHSFSANCSLGVALVNQAEERNVSSPEALISQADVACRLAKSQGRNRACRYEPDEKAHRDHQERCAVAEQGEAGAERRRSGSALPADRTGQRRRRTPLRGAGAAGGRRRALPTGSVSAGGRALRPHAGRGPLGDRERHSRAGAGADPGKGKSPSPSIWAAAPLPTACWRSLCSAACRRRAYRRAL